MSETSALRPGQKVTLTGTVQEVPEPHEGCVGVRIDGDYETLPYRLFLYSALTPVVEPEPTWTPGDHVQIDGVDYMLHELLNPQGYRIWCGPRGETLHVGLFSERWSEGRVVVVYRKEADK